MFDIAKGVERRIRVEEVGELTAPDTSVALEILLGVLRNTQQLTINKTKNKT